jgi:ribosomal protein L22
MAEEKETKNKMEEETKTEEVKKEETKKTSPKVEVKKEKFVAKEKASANGYSLKISHKNTMAICDVIRGKSPEAAVIRLEDVLKGKRVIPMAGREVGHKKGIGLAGARYPMNACKEMIPLLKQLGANAIVNGIENPVITLAKANIASRPHKSDGRRAKRTHISLEVMDKTKLVKKKKK